MAERVLTIWFTGLSGAGKSTLARGLSRCLTWLERYRAAIAGIPRADERRLVAQAANELNRKGITAIVAAISPYREARARAREQCDQFVEVFVDCELEALIQRDPKGLYRRALAGEIEKFSGVSDPYEAPEKPDIYINSATQTEEESLALLIAKLVL